VDICHSAKVGIALSFALMQKKQKIKENPPVGGPAPIPPRVFPCLRSAKACRKTLKEGWLFYPVCLEDLIVEFIVVSLTVKKF